MSAIMSLTLVLERPSPLAVWMPAVKKYFISKMPWGVCMYLPDTARLTVVSCTPTTAATCTMVQVAEVVGVHETTVSRAVSGKYMQTPQGIFEMKYFFTAGIQTSSGDGVSNTSVKDMIADIFKAEDTSKPLSDQEVVRMLKEKGIVIARRTVAKYRTELNILPSNLRKVY